MTTEYIMQIGSREWSVEGRDIPLDDVILWEQNPRTVHLGRGIAKTEDQIAADLVGSPGYSALKSSIKKLGQLERIYVRELPNGKYQVVEGNTRVTILRELAMEVADPGAEGLTHVKAKVLPAALNEEEILFLLASIHIRGTGVRNWTRYSQARFVCEATTARNGQPAVTTRKKLGEQMGKSESWISRLIKAYEFAVQYMEYHDDADAEQEALEQFSTLEEISRAKGFGTLVRDDANPELQAQVFDMVRGEVFSEYRDARYMQQFYEDPDKWSQLIDGTPGIAAKLANEVKAGESSVGDRILALPRTLERELTVKQGVFGEDHLEALAAASTLLENELTGAAAFMTSVRAFSNALDNVRIADLERVEATDLDRLAKGIARVQKLVKDDRD